MRLASSAVPDLTTPEVEPAEAPPPPSAEPSPATPTDALREVASARAAGVEALMTAAVRAYALDEVRFGAVAEVLDLAGDVTGYSRRAVPEGERAACVELLSALLRHMAGPASGDADELLLASARLAGQLRANAG